MTTETTTLRIKSGMTSKGFGSAVRDARGMRGKFDGAGKTWTVPASEWVHYIETRRFIPFDVVTGCAGYTRDNGCPMHGETCAA